MFWLGGMVQVDWTFQRPQIWVILARGERLPVRRLREGVPKFGNGAQKGGAIGKCFV